MKLSAMFPCLIALALVAHSAAHAFKIEDMGLEKKSSLSHLVVIGRVESVSESSGIARLVVESTLKGLALKAVDFRFDTGIVDNRVDCCRVRQSYLLFLVNEGDGIYRSVNGRFGVYSIAAEKPRHP